MNIKITPANVLKVISIANAVYWALTGWVFWSFRTTIGSGLWSKLISGDWKRKGGGWVPLLFLIGLCGAGCWALLAPTAIRAFKANLRPFGMKKLGKAVWCLSTVPAVVLLCFLCVAAILSSSN